MTPVWIAVLAAGAASYGLRVLPLLLGDRVRLSPRAQTGLRHAGMGAITGLLVLGTVTVLRPSSGLPIVPVLVALGAAVTSALLRWSMLATVLAGITAYGGALLVIALGAGGP